MGNRKIIVYPKSAMKPIILTDASDASLEEVQNQVIEVLKDNKISILNTDNDRLVIRPSEIQAILITKKTSDEVDGKYTKSLEESDDTTVT